jgi:hypothetical protein
MRVDRAGRAAAVLDDPEIAVAVGLDALVAAASERAGEVSVTVDG